MTPGVVSALKLPEIITTGVNHDDTQVGKYSNFREAYMQQFTPDS